MMDSIPIEMARVKPIGRIFRVELGGANESSILISRCLLRCLNDTSELGTQYPCSSEDLRIDHAASTSSI
jgi:hypothetical protein